MTAILQICKLTSAGTPASEGVPAVPGVDYFFHTTYGVYVGDLATATGISTEGADDDWSNEVATPVKELIRTGHLGQLKVRIAMTDGTRYTRNLHYNMDTDNVKGEILEKTWPVGKPAGGLIYDTLNTRRVTSRI